ncbi:MAG TPA: GNAT family N-acetyltransferase [Bacillales bacterium]|nr:GNAT family N-acetyltransferase [Bacillales bacterium]
MFKVPGLKFLDGKPNYFALEDIGQITSVDEFKELLSATVNYVKEEGIESVSITLDDNQIANSGYVQLLGDLHFQEQGIQYFYKRDLMNLSETEWDDSFNLVSIEEISPEVFKKVWKASATGSLNASSSLSIDKEFEGMQSELGRGYEKSCLTAFQNGTPIGITMPHIEPGTTDEGRLFYFGLKQEYRGKGYGVALHRQSLNYLKELGAALYIGATGHENLPMQQIFQANGCQKFDTKVTFRLESC